MTFIVDGTNGLTFPNSTTQASAGNVLQVVNASYSTLTSNATQTFADTGLTATITPKFSTSKILVLVNHANCSKSNENSQNDLTVGLYRNGSSIATLVQAMGYNGTASWMYFCVSATYVDSPASTSALTYKTMFKNQDNNGSKVIVQENSVPSTITLIEVAA